MSFLFYLLGFGCILLGGMIVPEWSIFGLLVMLVGIPVFIVAEELENN